MAAELETRIPEDEEEDPCHPQDPFTLSEELGHERLAFCMGAVLFL